MRRVAEGAFDAVVSAVASRWYEYWRGGAGTLLIGLAIVTASVFVLFALALLVMAKSGDEHIAEGGPIAALGMVNSPSGRPFLATWQAGRDLATQIDDVLESVRRSPPNAG